MDFGKFAFTGKLETVLTQRRQSPDNEELGPVDLCYLHYVPSATGLLRWWKSSSSYLFPLLGSVRSSPNHAAAFLQQFYSAPRQSLSQACYCVYDVFSKSDVRLHLAIPGQTRLEVINEDSSECTDRHWTGAYLSSVLRYFNNSNGCIQYSPFERVEDIILLLKHTVEFPKMTVEYKELLFQGVSQHLLKLQAFQVHQQVFSELSRQEPTALKYVTDLYVQLQQTPPKLVKQLQGKAALWLASAKLMKTPQAVRAAVETHLVQHAPDWESCALLAESFVDEGLFAEALLCLNQAVGLLPALTAEPSDHTFWQKPMYFDFQTTRLPMKPLKAFDFLDRETHFLTKSGKVVYRVLTKMWRNLGWYELEVLRKMVFVRDGSQPADDLSGLSHTGSYYLQDNSNTLSLDWRQCLTVKDTLTFRLGDQDVLEQEHPKFTHLLRLFRADLKALQDWDLDRRTPGEIWLARGWLAKRLQKPRKAVIAFKCALLEGTSLFALYSLLKLHISLRNSVEAAEAFLGLLQQVQAVDTYPDWLFTALCALCSRFGLRTLLDHCGGNAYIVQAISLLREWQVHGINA